MPSSSSAIHRHIDVVIVETKQLLLQLKRSPMEWFKKEHQIAEDLDDNPYLLLLLSFKLCSSWQIASPR